VDEFGLHAGGREIHPPVVHLSIVRSAASGARPPTILRNQRFQDPNEPSPASSDRQWSLPMIESAWQAEPSALEEDALLASALLGGGLPPEAEHHLWEAGKSYHLDDVAEAHLKEAEALAPGHAAVLIGLYRFYFYKGRLRDALAVAEQCLEKAARENRLVADWRLVTAGEARFGSYEDMLPRFYLFTLKGYAFLQMRLGNIEEGRTAVVKLLELDPSDKVGAKVLLDVLRRVGQDDD
jgi:tetratricopeptide (TPR) repeat protein